MDIAEAYAAATIEKLERESRSFRTLIPGPATRKFIKALVAMAYAEGRLGAFNETMAEVKALRSERSTATSGTAGRAPQKPR